LAQAAIWRADLVALGLPRSLFRVATGYLTDLRNFNPERARDLAFELRAEVTFSTADWANEVAFLLSDGLSLREDQLVWALSERWAKARLWADRQATGCALAKTFVLHGARFMTDAAVLAVLRTPCRVTAFRFDHLDAHPTAHGGDRCRPRAPAGARDQWHARRAGICAHSWAKTRNICRPSSLRQIPWCPKSAMTHHVLAIQRVEPDGTLRFFSAIETGLVLRLAESRDLVAHLDARIGAPARRGATPAILACDCILRRLEAENTQARHHISKVLDRHTTSRASIPMASSSILSMSTRPLRAWPSIRPKKILNQLDISGFRGHMRHRGDSAAWLTVRS
jgi:hypothetical protein